jgi:GTP-binding protein
VADYPFTTLEPVLGTIDGEDRQIVVADIPGLIEGAAQGAGLGHDFLAHVERTRVLVHVLDLAPLDGSDPEQNFETIEGELGQYDERLASLPRILVLSKADLVSEEQAADAARRWHARFAGTAPHREDWEEPVPVTPVLVTSSATGQGLDELKAELLRRVELRTATEPALDGALEEHRVYRPSPPRRDVFSIEPAGEGAWRVIGESVDRLIARHDLENEEALAHVEHRLKRMGVIQALMDKGFEPGDDVEIAGIVFELDPG